MFATTLQGFTLGLAMIIPIGAQNAFVLSRGIHRNHHLLTATLCSFCDLILIGIGVFGGATVLSASPIGMALLTWGGVLFLSWFGVRSLRSACRLAPANGGQKRAGDDAGRHPAKSPCLSRYPDVARLRGQSGGRVLAPGICRRCHAGLAGMVLLTGAGGCSSGPLAGQGEGAAGDRSAGRYHHADPGAATGQRELTHPDKKIPLTGSGILVVQGDQTRNCESRRCCSRLA